MAEKGAHLTQTAQIKPSLFDFVAQESLHNLLYPSTKKIIYFLHSRNNNFRFAAKWADELFLIGHFFLQLHYLKSFSGTFSESFYGLKRVCTAKPGITLSQKKILLSLLFCSLFPYLREKLNQIVEKIYFEILPNERKKKNIMLLKSIIGLHSGFNVSYQIVIFIHYLNYLSGKSDVISPLLRASGVKLEYMTLDESSVNATSSLRSFILMFLRRGLEIGAFFLQFCQWWQRERIGNLNSLPPPPPPKTGQNGRFSGICPLCNKKRKSETVLSVSGFVYCFTCIVNYLNKYNKCPVTNLPANINNLILLYTPD